MKGKKNLKITLLCAAVCGILLTGCGNEMSLPEDTAEAETSAPKESYTVRFMVNGRTISMQLVKAGGSPSVPEVNIEGYVFSHWEDEQGNGVRPDMTVIGENRVFSAVMNPEISVYTPYLFVDEKGFANPGGLLTGQDLSRALKALAVVNEALGQVSIDIEADQWTAGALQTVLNDCFREGAVQAALADLAEAPVTRSDFARVMNKLLGRKETVKITQQQTLPPDVPLQEDMENILKAVLNCEYDPEGSAIHKEVLLGMRWQPGFTNLGGWLYYADENGKLLVNGELGTLTFGADGRFTCGDEELDKIAAELIAGFIAEDPEADRETLLMKAFVHTRDSFNYVNRGILDTGATGWETEKAKQMFDKGSGNCYNYAAVFWALARQLGYDAVCCSGKALSNAGPHAWVQIEMDGKPYIFDPQLAWRETTGERTNWGEDMFKIPERLWHQWRYIYP